MPKTKFEGIVFTLFMSFLMVYAMICYNIALNMGGMSGRVFLLSFHELIIIWPVAFILEYFFVDKLAHYFTFKVVTPKDRPFFITLAISFYIICIICPIMSLIATILFKTPGVQIISVWFMTILFIQWLSFGKFVIFKWRKLHSLLWRWKPLFVLYNAY